MLVLGIVMLVVYLLGNLQFDKDDHCKICLDCLVS